MSREIIDICWVRETITNRIGCMQKWKRFTSRAKAKKWMAKCENNRRHMFFRFILVNNMEVEHL